jgi:trimethylamine--corrinoid protein Co-methyltransferase
MLDFVLTFSLPKLVFDNEVCGQVLHFVREIEPREDLPTTELVRELIANDHLITSPHTLKHWPQELYLTDPVFDRENREAWEKAGSTNLDQRARDGVEKRLASYLPIDTDAALDAEMRRIVQSGMQGQRELPALPPLPDPAQAPAGPRKRRGGRRHLKTSTA